MDMTMSQVVLFRPDIKSIQAELEQLYTRSENDNRRRQEERGMWYALNRIQAESVLSEPAKRPPHEVIARMHVLVWDTSADRALPILDRLAKDDDLAVGVRKQAQTLSA